MSFVSLDFLALMAVVFTAYWALRDRRAQNVLLVVASAVFYGWIHPWFVLLMLFSAVLDYTVARNVEADRARAGRWLAVSLVGNLGLLAAFKYFDWFSVQVATALGALGLSVHPFTLGLLLPAGISFYTFQTLSYTIDVYKGRLKARTDLLDVLVYVGFFPQLVAGPIERADRLLPQVENERRFSWVMVRSGLSLALWGAVKKACVADVISPYVDEVFLVDEPAFALWFAACWAFGVQIYADFSGYTDIARGTARMLGFELVENFDRPYRAASTPEFWRRWHISLSTWVGDYVYTPLLRRGRPGPLRTLGAIFVTFFLIGLWHGASWNFILLGLYNGLWMAIYTFATPMVPLKVRSNPVAWGLGVVFHTLVVLQPTALLFRERDVGRVWTDLTALGQPATRDELVAATIVASMAVLGSIPLSLGHAFEDHVLPRLKGTVWLLPVQTTGWSLAAVAIFIFYRDVSQDFIYFEF